ncbi:hypothetical protein [Streptomyces sp. NBC_00258]|uniref:hypothetical protein n=1 Tax=Streptomyces sp. NBC_00258 TaxID=2903642 RepID=UPI002E2B4DD0|nr:hypothetical protein [Streptomyces sp. NBC_00258]
MSLGPISNPEAVTPRCGGTGSSCSTQLRSTHAVVGYLHRVGTSAPVLGGEPERYYELAAAAHQHASRALRTVNEIIHSTNWMATGGFPSL